MAEAPKLPAGTASLPYRQEIESCLERRVPVHGLSDGALGGWLGRAAPALDELKEQARSGAIPLFGYLERDDDIAAAEAALARLSKDAGTIVFYGTGGSSLGGQTLAQAGGWSIPGEAGPERRRRPRVRFYDNIDPRTLERSLANLDLGYARFVVTSKSGGTAETLSQAIAAIEAVKARGLASRLPELFLGITEPSREGARNGLRELFGHFGIPCLEHPPGVGGRYSALTIVGLMPAIAMGLDARRIRRGAAAVVAQMHFAASPADCPAALGAAVAVALNKTRGIRTLVMMPYADRLARLGDWYVQLWAESLGKDGEGTTPVAALGPVDQHSQLQLYMEGARDHLITFVRLDRPERGPVINAALARMCGIDYLAGRSVGDLVAAQSHAVPEALIGAGRPVRILDVSAVDEETMGALMMHFILETILAARLLGVDPFSQPGVEAGKKLAVERLEGTA